jgi:UDP-N-acetylmuramate--alanine ligase
MRIGILFGGPSREREISFAGGRTVFDNLNKSLFQPVPVFIDSLKNFILLDWQYIYKGSVRDFYPPVSSQPESPNNFQIYIESLSGLSNSDLQKIFAKVGRRIQPHELAEHIDFAFLCLHGAFGEDGVIQGILESMNIPYSGSGTLPSAIGMNKAYQKQAMQNSGWHTPKFMVINRAQWFSGDQPQLFVDAVEKIGTRLVVRPANQGSSIGVSILLDKTFNDFVQSMDRAFFCTEIEAAVWKKYSAEEKVNKVRELSDIRESVGLPLLVNEQLIHHPEALLHFIEKHFAANDETLFLEALDSEQEVIVESFIEGKEFSCIVIRNFNGHPVALPPTEIVKGKEVFDYRSKYLAGLSRKVTPIRLPNEQIEAIRKDCEKLFTFFGFHVYARIDGFIQQDGKIFLNDPNTTSGMLPSSFFFHQAAEIGLNPSQFLTYIIRTSLMERMKNTYRSIEHEKMLDDLDERISQFKLQNKTRKKIAVVLGGYSSERHISVESGRNIFEKLSSSEKYEPIPVFLTGSNEKHLLYRIPVNIMLKDNADDIKDKIEHYAKHEVIENIKHLCSGITSKYASSNITFEPKQITYAELAELADGVFIALHGRPGEDGALQTELEKVGLPYNGSGAGSSQITINKYETLQILKQNGFKVTGQKLFYRKDFHSNADALVNEVLSQFDFPFIAKPVDDGCSSAVKKVKNKEELKAFLNLLFRNEEALNEKDAAVLKLKPKEEFPKKGVVLLENFISREGAKYFLEITGGLLTSMDEKGNVVYEMFEPSETLVADEVLSLEEKFLAGEGQNITPARFGKTAQEYEIISTKVKADLKKAAEILKVQGYCRIDAFVRVSEKLDVETIVIEVNSLPGMTPATCIFHQAAINGYKPYDFIDHILEFGFKRQQLAVH